MKVDLQMHPPQQIVRRLGLNPGGKVQMFHTQNVMRRIQKFMPYRTGATIKIMINQTDISKPEIVLDVPYAKYLFYGKVMIGSAPKKVIDVPLKYTKTYNQDAGPFWDRKLVAAEGDQLVQELQDYIGRGEST